MTLRESYDGILDELKDHPIQDVLCVFCGRKHATQEQYENYRQGWGLTKDNPALRTLLEDQIKSLCWTRARSDPKGTCMANILAGADTLEIRLADLSYKVYVLATLMARVVNGMSGPKAMVLMGSMMEKMGGTDDLDQ